MALSNSLTQLVDLMENAGPRLLEMVWAPLSDLLSMSGTLVEHLASDACIEVRNGEKWGQAHANDNRRRF